ncbi:hypothetical protein BaRGS_00002526, partial [Batillaria attramentaria]
MKEKVCLQPRRREGVSEQRKAEGKRRTDCTFIHSCFLVVEENKHRALHGVCPSVKVAGQPKQFRSGILTSPQRRGRWMPALFRVTMSLPSIPRLIRLTAMAAVLIVTVHLVSLALSDPIPSPPTSSPGERCVPMEKRGPCGGDGAGQSRGVMLPNLYGHYTVSDALGQLQDVLRTVTSSSTTSSEVVSQFLCTLYLPPCPSTGEGLAVGVGAPLPLPCRPLCEMARGEVERASVGKGDADKREAWPSNIRCHMFPTERCYSLA